MPKVIRLGDSTSHGGQVVSATSHVLVEGKPVARLGDKCTCPKRGHNNCVIVEGDSNWVIEGIPVALEGHKISCGAILISSAPNTRREYETDLRNLTNVQQQNANKLEMLELDQDEEVIEQYFSFVDTAGVPINGYCYDMFKGRNLYFQAKDISNGVTLTIDGDVEVKIVSWLSEELRTVHG